jgi:glycosyltransferase involved in cell wall biosynthesis
MVLSIITINKNNYSGLKITIESVLSQSCRDFEYIVIDGASTDGSIDVLRKYDNEIDYWISEPDNGIYNAMNKGIRAAKGRNCQFLNSGDFLVSSDVIKKVLPNIENASIYVGYLIKIFSKKKHYLDKGIIGNITMFSLYKGVINHSSAYIKRELFDQYGYYDETLKIVSDWKWYLWVVGFHNEKVVKLNFVISKFDMGGISTSNKELLKIERRQVIEEYFPPMILADYDSQWRNIDQAIRINKYRITRLLFLIVERTIFKLEKWNLL